MDPITLSLGVLKALVNSGVGSSVLSGLGGLLFGDKGKEVADKINQTASSIFGTTDPRAIELAIQQDKSKAERFVAQVAAETDRYRIEVEDRKDARIRDLEIRKLPGASGMPTGSNVRANIMLTGAFSYIIGATAFIFMNIESLASPGAVAVLTFLTTSMGGVIAMLGQAFSFEFGSSRGSSEKTNQMAEMNKALAKT